MTTTALFQMVDKINILRLLCRIKEKGTWSDMSAESLQGPHLYRGTFQVNDEPQDTFLNMENWTKGVCFINGHNLGRYWIKGPQGTLYLPAPWLQKGQNEASMVTYMKEITCRFQDSSQHFELFWPRTKLH